MRPPLLLVTAVLALAACKNNDQHDNTMNVDENLSAENIVSNDVTAIDAVTGDAANMAAEADMNDIGNMPVDQGNASASGRPKPAPSTVGSTPTNVASNGQ